MWNLRCWHWVPYGVTGYPVPALAKWPLHPLNPHLGTSPVEALVPLWGLLMCVPFWHWCSVDNCGTTQNSFWSIEWTLNHCGCYVVFQHTFLHVLTKNSIDPKCQIVCPWFTSIDVRKNYCTIAIWHHDVCCLAIFNTFAIWHPIFIENIPISTWWTLKHYLILENFWHLIWSGDLGNLRTCGAGLKLSR